MKRNDSFLKNLAGRLERKASGLSFFQQKLLLVIILIPVMLYCSFLLLGGAKDPLSFSQIKVPVLNKAPFQQQLQTDIINLNGVLDSLAQTPEGKALLDSMEKARPGFSDSIRDLKHK